MGRVEGSSPLARGLRFPESLTLTRGGIIPARAGFTRPWRRCRSCWPDHPRSRGVYPFLSPYAYPSDGSSPLARGLPAPTPVTQVFARIIPARAGFTWPKHRPSTAHSDHPRSRGVYCLTLGGLAAGPGSSPLARGLLTQISCNQAYVTDHPRSRGVYRRNVLTSSIRRGSSPLARGLRVHAKIEEMDARIIPARAGFTLADPWNPNDEPHYQTAFAFTADLVLAPQSSDSAVVSQRSTRTPSEA